VALLAHAATLADSGDAGGLAVVSGLEVLSEAGLIVSLAVLGNDVIAVGPILPGGRPIFRLIANGASFRLLD
jgi:hypothetical protein